MTSSSSNAGPTPPTPRWVKVFGIVTVIFVLIFAALHLTGRSLGGHMPSDHFREHSPVDHKP